MNKFDRRLMITRRGALLAAATSIMLTAVVLPGSAQTAPPAVTSAHVSIDNFTFTPQTLTVKAGTTVTWTNRDDIPHGIASDNKAFARSKPLDTDDSYSVTFTTPGTFKYFCFIHSHMTGTIIVEPTNS
jgi:plastocyanin